MRCFSPDRMPGLSMMLMLFRTWLGSCEHMNLEEKEQGWGQKLDLAEVSSNCGAPWALSSRISVRGNEEGTDRGQ